MWNFEIVLVVPFNKISLFFGYFSFEFLEYKGILLATFGFRRSVLAVFAKRNYSLDKFLFENSFCLFFQFAQF